MRTTSTSTSVPVRWLMALLAVVVATTAVACAGTPTNPVVSSPSGAIEEDTAARLLRIEHGLMPEVRVKGEPGASLEERMRAHHTPGVSIAIIHNHRVVASKAYGLADAVTKEKLTETTLLQAASVSKTFTAVAALREVEARKMSLDTNVNQTLKSWHLPENEFTRTQPVTLKHLLAHSGGINVPTGAQDGPSPTVLESLEGKPPALTKPVRVTSALGTFRYSGGGTTIIQQMLIDVEQRPFPDLMNDLVFTPLKLSHSTFASAPVKSERFPKVASGHDFDQELVDTTYLTWAGAAAGGMWSTPTDIAQLLVEVQLGLRGQSKVISKEIATRLTTPVVPVTKDNTISTALGTFVEKHGNGTYFGHDGHGIGFLTISRASTTDGEGAVVMANSQVAAPLMLEIFRSIAAEYAWAGWLNPPIDPPARVDPAHLAALSGRYKEGTKESMVITVKGGDHLEARQPFQDPLDLWPLANAKGSDVYVSRTDAAEFTFVPAENKVMLKPRPWPPAGSPATLTRLPNDAPLEPLQLLEAGRVEEATALGLKQLKENPKDPTLDESHLEDIGEDLLSHLDPKRAIAVLQLNFALHPQSPSAAVNVAEALLRGGHRAEAEAAQSEAKKLFANDTLRDKMSEFAQVFFSYRLSRMRAAATAMGLKQKP